MSRLVSAIEKLAAVDELKGIRALYAVGILGLAIAGVGWLVYGTGGIRYVYSHSVYLPVVLAAFLFGAPGGALAGIVGGLVLGPFMPIDTDTGQIQSTLNWTYRLLFLVLVGATTGMLVSLLRRHTARVQWLSVHDPQTGIPNARALFDDVRRAVNQTKGRGGFRLIVVDLCNYLDITSTLGPEVGAALTNEVATRIRNLLNSSSLICSVHTQRLGFILPNQPESTSIEKIGLALQEPYALEELNLYVDTAIGSAQFPDHGDSPDRLLQRAIIAMHSAQQRGVTHLPYDIANDKTSRENLELLGELPNALKDRQVTLFYQPKVDLRSNEIAGVEALVRWHHPTRGWIAPGSFLPYVENTALIHTLTLWVFQRAVEQIVAWREAGISLHIAVNVSMRNLQEPSIIDSIERIITDRSFANSMVEIEVTESALLLDPQSAAKLFERWRAHGLRIAIDDFGTGHASLAYIKELPIDVIKIDQTFIRSLQTSSKDRAIVRAAIDLARHLELKTVSEGVEDPQSLEYLREQSSDYAQGYAIQRPLPADQLQNWFAQTQEFKLPRSR